MVSSAMAPLPSVGVELLERDGPLATLEAARHAAANGRGSVVVISGEPGIGKTALVRAFLGAFGDDGRVWWGLCDDLSIPRPLGPLRDIARVSPLMAQAMTKGVPPTELHNVMIDDLVQGPHPTAVVIEDVHWADDATLDLITVVGRRVASLPAVLVLTLRDCEVAAGDRLRLVLGTLPADATRHLTLAPLSAAAVAEIAGQDAARIYAATNGNPFFVTELVAARPGTVPRSVRDAVLARSARLGRTAQRLLQLISVVPGRVDAERLDALFPGWPAAAEEPERRQLLDVDAGGVRFRHELARIAIASSLPTTQRRALHAEVLDVLLATGADPADIVHHAEGSGDLDVVAQQALIAAHDAAVVASYRQAHAHFRRAAELSDRLEPSQHAPLYEDLAVAAYTVGHLDEALVAIGRALARYQECGDRAALGRCTRWLSRLHWFVGDRERARRAAQEAVELLQPLGDSSELARAYSGLSRLAMVSGRVDETLKWGQQAVTLARRLGDQQRLADALVNIGTVRVFVDIEDADLLLEAHALAVSAGDNHNALRALSNLAACHLSWAQPAPALQYVTRARAYAGEHEVELFSGYIPTMAAWLRMRAGDWSAAHQVAHAELDQGTTLGHLLAKSVLAELAVRRGDTDAAGRLAQVREQADRTGELRWIVPVLELETEWSLTSGAPLPQDHFDSVEEIVRTNRVAGSDVARVAAWAVVAGRQPSFSGKMPRPHAAMLSADWAAAAQAFGDIGWSYDRALMLFLLDDASRLVEALSVARQLGAPPLSRCISRRLRQLGHPVPRGVAPSTRTHPARLTSRQAEVLALLADGRTNSEIAEALYVSTRTVEHHVTAVLTKLGAGTRRDAVHRAAALTRSDAQ
jgi:DNA-binding CsgD family transcriptional regulator/tetratricopeptide (TPR) repeat protein